MDKLRDIDTDMLQGALLAVQDLRRKYLGTPQVTPYAAGSQDEFTTADKRCPLCMFQLIAVGKYPWERDLTEDGECFCPWYWLEGHKCEEYINEDGDMESYDDIPVACRLERVDRWEAAITAELARRAK